MATFMFCQSVLLLAVGLPCLQAVEIKSQGMMRRESQAEHEKHSVDLMGTRTDNSLSMAISEKSEFSFDPKRAVASADVSALRRRKYVSGLSNSNVRRRRKLDVESEGPKLHESVTKQEEPAFKSIDSVVNPFHATYLPGKEATMGQIVSNTINWQQFVMPDFVAQTLAAGMWPAIKAEPTKLLDFRQGIKKACEACNLLQHGGGAMEQHGERKAKQQKAAHSKASRAIECINPDDESTYLCPNCVDEAWESCSSIVAETLEENNQAGMESENNVNDMVTLCMTSRACNSHAVSTAWKTDNCAEVTESTCSESSMLQVSSESKVLLKQRSHVQSAIEQVATMDESLNGKCSR